MMFRFVGKFVVLLFAMVACSREIILTRPGPEDPMKPPAVERDTGGDAPDSPVSDEPESPKSPGEIAAIQLTDQGRRYLEAGNVEEAIRVLERSVALHPYNAEGYFLLAEAWIRKKDVDRAFTFNRMAQTYLKGDPVLKEQIWDQYRKIVEIK